MLTVANLEYQKWFLSFAKNVEVEI